jgi:protein FAM50
MRKGRTAQLKEDVNRKKAKLQEQQAPLAIPSFAAPSTEYTATSGTMGLLTVEEFRQKRESMLRDAAAEKQKQAAMQKQASIRASKAARARRSFVDEEEEEEEQKEKEAMRVVKDPTVETSFLPDSRREGEEERIRGELASKWQDQQEVVKSEALVVIFSFWDGKGSRRALRVQKVRNRKREMFVPFLYLLLCQGSTIGQFMKQVRDTVEDVRGVATDSLMFVKHDLIVPHHFTFYELLMGRDAAGKPLFDFSEEGSHHTKVTKQNAFDMCFLLLFVGF